MPSTTPIRILIVDDQAVVRSGLGAFLMAYDGFELVGEAGGGEAAIQQCEALQPDVVLMDLKMPGMNGAAATRLIRQRWPHIQVLALTSFKEKDLVESALEAGAAGYLLKNISSDELVEAIRSALAGRTTLAPEATEALDQSRKLEALARALLDSAPDASELPAVLARHLPQIFPGCQVQMVLFPDRVLFAQPAAADPPLASKAWPWLQNNSPVGGTSILLMPGMPVPWEPGEMASTGLLLAPVRSTSKDETLGGIFVAREDRPDTIEDLLPVVQPLAEQIASALNHAEIYAQNLARQKIAQELALAARVQMSILPASAPKLPGWQIATHLVPAREASGDFYDFIPLPGDRLGFVIADVTDKGLGAALFMALGSTLLRTYAGEYHNQPRRAFAKVNRRILSDTHGGLFVSAFYGVLDPATGELHYCNAGHNPPFLLGRAQPRMLPATGMPLGVASDAKWEQVSLQLSPGEVLLLYTDGVTEANNPQGAFYGEERLLAIGQEHSHLSAEGLAAQVLKDLKAFTGPDGPYDDVTLMVVRRSPLESETTEQA